MNNELVEAVARVISEQLGDDWDDDVHALCGDDFQLTPDGAKEACRSIAYAAIALIRPATLEEAAKVAEAMSDDWAAEWRENLKRDSHLEGMSDGAHDVAAAIRALKDKA